MTFYATLKSISAGESVMDLGIICIETNCKFWDFFFSLWGKNEVRWITSHGKQHSLQNTEYKFVPCLDGWTFSNSWYCKQTEAYVPA